MSPRKKGMPAAHGNEVNVTPLIDVIMCLIIFFMLVAKIGVSTGAKPMDLPYSLLGKHIEDMGPTLTLNILPVGDMERIKAKNESERIAASDMQVTALVDGIDRDLAIENPQVANLEAPERHPLRVVLTQMKGRYKEQFKVIIRADADLPFTLVQPVLVECANAAATNIFFTTQKGGENAPAAAGGGATE
jgi:biopolymer transport protein ExbD